MKSVIVYGMRNIPGTRQWEKYEKGTALFHQFGVDFEELDGGPGSYSTAIIEWEDGLVDMVRADMIQFVKQEEAK